MTKFAKFFNGKESKTIAEAKQKKKISKIVMLSCLGGMILFAVLGGLIGGVITTIGVILAMASALTGMYFWLRLNCARKELFILQNLFCSECNTRFNLHDTSYTVQNTKTLTTRNDNRIKLDTYTYVIIKCKCSKCGHEHEFKYDFLTKRRETNLAGATLSEQTYSLDDRIEEFFYWKQD